MLYFDEGSEQVKIATHARFDEWYNYLPVDQVPPNCLHTLCRNGTPLPADSKEIANSDLEFFLYPFSNKEIVTVPVLPNSKDATFGFTFSNNELYGQTYIKDISDTKSSLTS